MEEDSKKYKKDNKTYFCPRENKIETLPGIEHANLDAVYIVHILDMRGKSERAEITDYYHNKKFIVYIMEAYMNLRELLFKLQIKFAKTNEKRNSLLRNKLWHISENSVISTDWFGNEPYLIWIGSNVIVAGGVRFNNHDASCWCSYRNLGIKAKLRHEKAGPIVLQDNCFVGANTMLLPNVVIGENSIIAAGSVVNRDIPPNEVWGGVPAKFIMNSKEYDNKILNYYNDLPWRDIELSLEQLKRCRQNFYSNRCPKQ